MRRIVETNMWLDATFRKKLKNDKERLLFIYILTSPESKLCGIFYIPIDLISYHTQLSIEEIKEAIKDFEDAELIKYNVETEEVAIANYLKYNVNKGGKPIEDAITRQLSLVKSKELISWVYERISKNITNMSLKKIVSIFNNYISNNNNNNNRCLISISDTNIDTQSDTLKTQNEISDESFQKALEIINSGGK